MDCCVDDVLLILHLVYSFNDISCPFLARLLLALSGTLYKFLNDVVELIFLLLDFLLFKQLIGFTLAQNLE